MGSASTQEQKECVCASGCAPPLIAATRYDSANYWQTLFRFSGTVLPLIYPHIICTLVVTYVAVFLYEWRGIYIHDEAHGIFGFLVGFLLVFR